MVNVRTKRNHISVIVNVYQTLKLEIIKKIQNKKRKKKFFIFVKNKSLTIIAPVRVIRKDNQSFSISITGLHYFIYNFI
jgi:hypothetical protein